MMYFDLCLIVWVNDIHGLPSISASVLSVCFTTRIEKLYDLSSASQLNETLSKLLV